jgi:hypothetical protein
VGTGFPQKTRQNKTLEPFHDSVKSKTALDGAKDAASMARPAPLALLLRERQKPYLAKRALNAA